MLQCYSKSTNTKVGSATRFSASVRRGRFQKVGGVDDRPNDELDSDKDLLPASLPPDIFRTFMVCQAIQGSWSSGPHLAQKPLRHFNMARLEPLLLRCCFTFPCSSRKAIYIA